MKTKLHLILLAALCLGGMLFVAEPAKASDNLTPEQAATSPADDELPFLEFQFSPIVSYAWGSIDSFGYGAQAAVFPAENLGVQIEYTYFSDVNSNLINPTDDYHAIAGSIIYRLADTTFEPYFLAGGGVLTSTRTRATWHVGAGLNFWATDTFSLFAEARYTWVDTSTGDPIAFGDFPSVTVGGRWSF